MNGSDVLEKVDRAASAFHNVNEWTCERADWSGGRPDEEHPSFREEIEKAAFAADETIRELLEACDAALAYIPASEVRSWPPGFALKKKAMELLKAATTNARGGK